MQNKNNSDKLNSLDKLENIVKSLIKKSTIIETTPFDTIDSNSQLKSHFGGDAYFEKDEIWPRSEKGKELDFIFQIFNNDSIELDENIKLVQFFYDWDEYAWQTEDDGWLIKIYREIDTENIIKIDNPNKEHKSSYCEINFKPSLSLPDWEGIDLHSPKASDLSYNLNPDKAWEEYDNMVTKLIGEQDFKSQIGGYPQWVQGEETPKMDNGSNMKFLFQIDSESDANIMWGDVGLIYVFYDEQSQKIEFIMQCC
ncbi:MAG: YwqG family protein [Marinifilaceae bacterium]|jgi:uncharacterized protein YwqG|nr:YwqG family protein [Marinifilaceae bacterium]